MGNNITASFIHTGQVETPFATSWTMALLKSHSRIYSVLTSTSPRINKARNEIVEQFLESDSEWLWNTDTDMIIPPDTLERLVEAADADERPIVGGLAFIYNPQREPTIAPSLFMPKPGTDGKRHDMIMRYPKDTLVEVAGTGQYCLLVHRRVFEDILENSALNGYGPYTWFDEVPLGPHRDSLIRGADVTFCFRAREAGYKIYVHTGIQLGHIKQMVVEEQTFKNYIQREPDDGVEDVQWLS
jgi:GT2 family glycosyltransferase